ncbi:E3 ubiquitin-protein ligase BRE1-like 2 [Apostasia shenzhenica]|uniref:E3 ubiquitin protein ligase n=1 Tax=Apostasia shenzhenica TaxID=1088818 RepID=A0A2I0AD68_9ASPA|nr:E3 ubiquitin-protein ligase BRE1-like 2 [Apostasia shenzhenica]
MEIKESEQRAQLQAELLRNAFDEHSLQLRVRAANEAEAACQQRLATAEAEIAELREKLDASERLDFFSRFFFSLSHMNLFSYLIYFHVTF